MHEASLMQNALELAQEQARLHRAARIDRLVLRVGRLAGVDPQALVFAFDVVSEGTMAEGAVLEIDDVPILCHCDHCLKEFSPADDLIFACPICGALSRDVRSGQELEMVRLEVSGDGT